MLQNSKLFVCCVGTQTVSVFVAFGLLKVFFFVVVVVRDAQPIP
jgi:hypothetical protein